MCSGPPSFPPPTAGKSGCSHLFSLNRAERCQVSCSSPSTGTLEMSSSWIQGCSRTRYSVLCPGFPAGWHCHHGLPVPAPRPPLSQLQDLLLSFAQFRLSKGKLIGLIRFHSLVRCSQPMGHQRRPRWDLLLSARTQGVPGCSGLGCGVQAPVLPKVTQLFSVRGKLQIQVCSCQSHAATSPLFCTRQMWQMRRVGRPRLTYGQPGGNEC